MTLDFSHLYNEVTKDVGAFTVTVREVPHGVYTRLQDEMFSKLDIDVTGGGGVGRQLKQALRDGRFSGSDFNDSQTVAAIKSWTLTDANGEPVPVELQYYKQLPKTITEKIEKVVKDVNPSLDEQFSDQSEGESTEPTD